MIQYSNFLIKREQSRAGSRFAECEKSRLKAKILMTLALLLTAVTGAWAQETETLLTTITATGTDSYSETTPGVVTVTHDNDDFDGDYGWLWRLHAGSVTVVAKEGYTITKCVFRQAQKTPFTISSAPFEVNFIYDEEKEQYIYVGPGYYYDGITSIEVYGAAASADPTIEVNPGSSANTWTFAMPGSDVVLTPLYAPAAKWDVVETVEQRPAALEGIIAGQDAAIVTPGQSAQGTVMYAVTTTADAAPALDAFSATVPTAKTYDDATTVYVWYYIQGHDTPDGQQPTEENTFNDSEISTTPLTVQVLTNKFDIQFTAANDNTIQAGKATVTVDGQSATVTDGKLQGVKMGSEVKMTAQPGYKFRKVEVKKGPGDTGKPLAEATVGMIVGSDGKAYAADDKDNLPSGVTAVAKVCYVSDGHGLALALTDEGEMNWNTAQTTCAAHTPAVTGGTWKLATKDEWNNMITAAGSPDALRDGFSSVGGTNMQSRYWSSTESDSSRAWLYSFSSGWKKETKDSSTGNYARACLEF